MTFRVHTLTAAALAFGLLAACTPTAPSTDNGGSSSSSKSVMATSSSSSVAARPLSKEGEICGGIAGLQCEPSLFCKYDGAYPDAAGVCVK